MSNTWKDKLIVASIDFGTTHSGFALSLYGEYELDNPNVYKIYTHTWKSGDLQNTPKTPTCLLLDDNKKFHSFGYDAENKYTSLVQNEQHKSWYYFRRFKMKLFDSGTGSIFTGNSSIPDTEGREFPAEEVFAHSLSYLKRRIVEIVQERLPTFRKDDIHYVLTTPAIWSERSKAFMRRAAIHAQIRSDHLRIALEPECAAVYVKTKEQLRQRTHGQGLFSPGASYMVIDIGGGTLDITVHRVNTDSTVEEILVPDGGPWGGDTINLKFEGFLISLVGGEAFHRFKADNREDFLDLQRTFESKKCAFENSGNDPITIRLPGSLRKLHKQRNKEKLSESIKQTQFADSIEMVNEKMRFSKELFRGFFKETIDNIVNKIIEVLGLVSENVKILVCVGGFSDCDILKQRIRAEFPGKNIIIPEDAVTAIMKGAIIYGRDESIIDKRLSRYTYGLDWNEEFEEQKHPADKKEPTDDGYVCKDIFFTLIRKNQPVSNTKATKEIEAYTKWKHQNTIEFPFYRSEVQESPEFIDEVGCHHVGSLMIDLPESNIGLDKCVTLKVYCGSTELRAEAVDTAGKLYKASFNLFETQV